jgi:hypothetical protein
MKIHAAALFAINRLMLRTAWRSRSRFSTRAMRT